MEKKRLYFGNDYGDFMIVNKQEPFSIPYKSIYKVLRGVGVVDYKMIGSLSELSDNYIYTIFGKIDGRRVFCINSLKNFLKSNGINVKNDELVYLLIRK